jgi:hypothetical protein
MKKLMSLLALTILSLNVVAQEFEVPANYKLNTKEDYTKYEPDILKAIDWLFNTPMQTKPEKRKDINAFVIIWITGSPNVSIEIKPEIVTFMEPNAELLMTFMCGWTKYALESKDYSNSVKGNLKGVEAVIDFYTKNIDHLKKDKHVEDYIKMKTKGNLEEFIKNNDK